MPGKIIGNFIGFSIKMYDKIISFRTKTLKWRENSLKSNEIFIKKALKNKQYSKSKEIATRRAKK